MTKTCESCKYIITHDNPSSSFKEGTTDKCVVDPKPVSRYRKFTACRLYVPEEKEINNE